MNTIRENITIGSLNINEVLWYLLFSPDKFQNWFLKTKDTVLLVLYYFNLSSEHYLATNYFLPCCHGRISGIVSSKCMFFIVYPAFSIQNWFQRESTKNTQLKLNMQRSLEVCSCNSLLKFEAVKCFLHYHLRLLPSFLSALSHVYLRLISPMNYTFVFQMAEFRAQNCHLCKRTRTSTV